MSPSRNLRSARYAFTLIELLIVIGIIAVLVALTTASVQKVRAVAVRVRVSNDITEMQDGMKAAMIKYNGATVLPSRLVLFNDLTQYLDATAPPGEKPFDIALRKRSADTLRKMFGPRLLSNGGYVSWDGASSPTKSKNVLEGQQCLVFYLGGVGGITGFSADPLFPMKPGGDRIGPFFPFKAPRLVGGKFPSYLDPHRNPTDPLARPYAYFSSTTAPNTYNPYFSFAVPPNPAAAQLSDCTSLGIWPYVDNTTSPATYLNPNGFQIISAGPDTFFGIGGGPPGSPQTFGGSVYNPKTGATNADTRDNQANFSSATLANPQ